MLEKQVSSDEMKLLFGETAEEKKEEEGPVPETPPTKEGIEEVGKKEERISIRPHDWAQKRRLSSEQMRTLHNIHALFAQQYQSELAAITKVQARITSKEPEQMRYEDFIKSLDTPTYINRLALPPLENPAALQVDLNLALTMIDRNLGGTGLPPPEEEIRALSEIEQRVLRHLLVPSLTYLRNRWEILISVQPTFMNAESIPYFLSIAFPEDIVIVLEFDVSLITETTELLKSKMRICYPYMTLQPIVSLLTESRLYEVGRGGPGPEQRINLNQVKVPVKCNLVRNTLTVEGLLNLEVGNIIELDVELNQASEVIIGQSRIFWGKPGTYGRKRAVKIESVIKEEVEPTPSIEPMKPVTPPEKEEEKKMLDEL